MLSLISGQDQSDYIKHLHPTFFYFSTDFNKGLVVANKTEMIVIVRKDYKARSFVGPLTVVEAALNGIRILRYDVDKNNDKFWRKILYFFAA